MDHWGPGSPLGVVQLIADSFWQLDGHVKIHDKET